MIPLMMGDPSGPQANPIAMWLPIILIFAIMYFFILRPQAKRQKQHQEMLKTLNKNDRVMTAGGIYGTIAGIKEKENVVILEIDKNVKVEVARSSIAKKEVAETK
jgi:preprotein translocase subunit YajC